MTDELKQWEYDRGYEKGKADVVDKLRAEIYEQYKWLINTRCTICDVDIAFNKIFWFLDNKCKAESEGEE